jgi:hypothetical protein
VSGQNTVSVSAGEVRIGAGARLGHIYDTLAHVIEAPLERRINLLAVAFARIWRKRVWSPASSSSWLDR